MSVHAMIKNRFDTMTAPFEGRESEEDGRLERGLPQLRRFLDVKAHLPTPLGKEYVQKFLDDGVCELRVITTGSLPTWCQRFESSYRRHLGIVSADGISRTTKQYLRNAGWHFWARMVTCSEPRCYDCFCLYC